MITEGTRSHGRKLREGEHGYGSFCGVSEPPINGTDTCWVFRQQQGENEKEILREDLGERGKRFATSGHISTSPRPGFPGSQTGAKEENDHRTEQPEKGAQAISHGEGMGNFQPTVIDPPKQFSSWGVHRIYYSIVSFIVSQVLIRLLLGGIAEQKSLRESEFSLSAMITGPS